MEGPASRRLLCLTMMGYRKPGIDENDLCYLMVNKHAQMISNLMEKYGIISYTITHNTEKVSSLLSQLFDPSRVAFSDHDFIVQIMFPDIESFLKLKADPLYIERIAQDHLSFSDPTDEKRKTRMTLGFVHEVVRDGKVTYVEDKEAVACTVNREILDGDTGRFQ
ncbi:hypothetical protein BJX76DRAFT_360013 [Aspergillus varians]